MAYEILVLDGAVDPVSADYPYGMVKNKPHGTRVNVKFTGDIMQLMQMMMGYAGVTPNNMPDNSTNGFQLFNALLGTINEGRRTLIPSAPLNGQHFTFAHNDTYEYATATLAANTIHIDIANAVFGKKVRVMIGCAAGDTITVVSGSGATVYNLFNYTTGVATATNSTIFYIEMTCVGVYTTPGAAATFTVEITNPA